MKMNNNAPVGIFDSGFGGLTVASAVKKVLPQERIIYFGDSAHLPYGDKSAPTIQAYSIKICDVLLQEGCKVILIACNSASAAAYELIKAYVGSKAKVINVIDPVVQYVSRVFAERKVGLIGTRQTIGSGVYRQKLQMLRSSVTLSSLATPLLAPMIEEGFHKNEISEQIIAEYLRAPEFEDIDALILGCTHYPLIRNEVDRYFDNKVQIVDSSVIVARALQALLTDEHMQADTNGQPDRFLVSDFTPSFQAAATLFFKQRVALEKHVLWE